MSRDETLGRIVISLSKLNDNELADILESLVEIENDPDPCWESDDEDYLDYDY